MFLACLLAWLLLLLCCFLFFFLFYRPRPTSSGLSLPAPSLLFVYPLFLFPLLFPFAFVVAFHSSLVASLLALIPATLPRFFSFLAHSWLILTHQTNSQHSPSTHHHKNKQHHKSTSQCTTQPLQYSSTPPSSVSVYQPFSQKSPLPALQRHAIVSATHSSPSSGGISNSQSTKKSRPLSKSS